MGFIHSFKAHRARPKNVLDAGPGFELNRFPLMRRLQTAYRPTILGAGFQTHTSVFVPANAWADLHELWVRMFIQVQDGGLPLPPGTLVAERLTSSPVMIPNIFPAAAFPVAPGLFEMVITRRFLREGVGIWYYDDDDTSGIIGIQNKVAGTTGIPIVKAAGSWDFSVPITFNFSINNAGAPYPISIDSRLAIALIQAPLNLRTI